MPIGAVGSAFVTLMVPILCLPSVTGSDLDAASMNWTALVYGAPMLGAAVWWVVDARKWFKGPRVNVEHLMHKQGEAMVDGDGGGKAEVRDEQIEREEF